jgi:predicted ester cyclase
MSVSSPNLLESNKQLCRRAVEELFGAGRLEVADEVLASRFVSHAAPPEAGTGPQSMKQTVGWLRSGLSELAYDVQGAVAEDDLVTLRVEMRGLNDRPFMGHPASGKRFRAQQIHMFRVADGQIAEHWACRDDVGMMRQLGFLPS